MDMQEIKRELQQIRVLCDTIERAVMGEEKTGQIGLVKRVAVIEKWRLALDLRIATMSGIGTTLVLIIKYFMDKS